MWPSFNPMLPWWGWIPLAMVPPAILALYFLKLKRQPLEVPSTYLWHKSIEDLHVNSIWQKLRQSLLLFLQLLLVLVTFLALLGPTWNDTRLPGDRFIFLLDTSASMAARDVAPSRLEEARRQALLDIDRMANDAVAMVISFSDTARVEQGFTGDHKKLRRAIESIKQTNNTTNMKEALQAAAGLANPGRSSTDATDTQVAEAAPAVLKIYSDGGLDRVEGFALGNLEPQYNQMGLITYEHNDVVDPAKRGEAVDWADNIGIVAFTTGRKEGRAEQLEAFARLQNFGPDPKSAELELFLDGELVDARSVEELPSGETIGVPFDLGEVHSGVLELRAKTGDVLPIDDRAWTTINPPRRAKVLLVTPGDEPLEYALFTDRARQLADVTMQPPEYLQSAAYKTEANTTYDLVIYDRCSPELMPQANTLFIGALPAKATEWKAGEKVTAPQILDSDRSHPLTQLVELGDVLIAEATPLEPPQGNSVLIDSTAGPLLAIAPRGGYEDAVLGFEIEGDKDYGTNWPVKLSFPVFVLNVLEYLGGGQVESLSVQPGKTIPLHVDAAGRTIQVRTPAGQTVTVERGNLNAFHFAQTAQVGVYAVVNKDDTVQRFAVNLFHPPESDIQPKNIEIGHTEVTGENHVEPARREAWKLLLLVALAVLLFEWYIYNRRVYL
jgi:hypothetical protein